MVRATPVVHPGRGTAPDPSTADGYHHRYGARPGLTPPSPSTFMMLHPAGIPPSSDDGGSNWKVTDGRLAPEAAPPIFAAPPCCAHPTELPDTPVPSATSPLTAPPPCLALRRRKLLRRGAGLPRPADGGADDPALAGRKPGRVEHRARLLPGGAARRVHLRPPLVPNARRQPAAAGAPGRHPRTPGATSPCPSRLGGARRGGAALGAGTVGGGRGGALLRRGHGGPLLQRWFAATGDPDAGDPYFLYAAGNAGSMLGLLAYPFLVEPTLPLAAQSWLWSGGYLLFLGLTAACAIVVLRTARAGPHPEVAAVPRAHSPVGALTRLRWVGLAFLPSSLLLGATTYISTDVAAAPLLWVVPLALYLATFILAFSRTAFPAAAAFQRWLPVVVLPAAVAASLHISRPVMPVIGLHLLALFAVGAACHSRLAEERPPVDRLTEFYLLISVGGVAGGLFNALLAPQLFDSLLEYPLVLVVALAAARFPAPSPRRVLGMHPGILPASLAFMTLAAGAAALVLFRSLGVVVATACLHTSRAGRNRVPLGPPACPHLDGGARPSAGHRARTPAGAACRAHILRDAPGECAGGVAPPLPRHHLHGAQRRDPGGQSEPAMYYHPDGPAGDVLRGKARNRPPRVRGPWNGGDGDVRRARTASDLLRDRPGGRAYRSRPCALLLSAPLPGGPSDRAGRWAADAGAGTTCLVRRHRPRRLLLRRHSGAPAHPRGGRDVRGAPSAGRRGRLPHLQPVPRPPAASRPHRPGAGAGGAGAQGPRRRHPPPNGEPVVGHGGVADALGAIAEDPRWGPVPTEGAGATWTDDYSNILGVLRRW
jgi:hypothetical protein